MATDTFERALRLVLELEGGFVEHPRDPGGATKFGITRATLADARGRPVSAADVRALGRDEAAGIYRRSYWEAVDADRLPAGIDLAVFDEAVHSGPARAVRALQGAVGAKPDGRMGPLTRAATETHDAAATVRALTRERLQALRTLPTWPTFGRGWTARVRRVEAEALKLAAGKPRAGPLLRPGAPVPFLSHAEGSPMIDTKTLLASRTVWANLIGLGALGLGMLGFDTASLDTGKLVEAATQIVAGASFVASTFFRIQATKQIAQGRG